MQNGASAIAELGNSKEGDRTMLDALLPAIRQLDKCLRQGDDIKLALKSAAAHAEEGKRNLTIDDGLATIDDIINGKK